MKQNLSKNLYVKNEKHAVAFTSTIRNYNGNPTYSHSSLSKEDILQNLMSVFNIFIIPNNQNQFELPNLIRYLSFIDI